MNAATEMANRALERFGYLVLAWEHGPKPLPAIGDVLGCDAKSDGGNVPGPFVVIGHATEHEYIAQAEAMIGSSRKARQDVREAMGFLKVTAE